MPKIPRSRPIFRAIAAALGLVLIGFALLEVRPAPDGNGAEPKTQPLRWTREPVRIDRDAQQLPRAPALVREEAFPLDLRISQKVKVPDSATFEFDGKTYRLAAIEPIPPFQICQDRQGRKWACGLQSRLALRNLLTGSFIECRAVEVDAEGRERFECLHSGRQLGALMVEKGWAVPTSPPQGALEAARLQAQQGREGYWADAEGFAPEPSVLGDAPSRTPIPD